MKALRGIISLLVVLSFFSFHLRSLAAETVQEKGYIQLMQEQAVLLEQPSIEAGVISKGTVLKIEKIENEFVFFQWNDRLVKVALNAVQFVDASEEEEFPFAYDGEETRTLSLNEKVPVVSVKDGSTIALISAGQSYRLYKEEADRYIVIIGNQLGFISKESDVKIVDVSSSEETSTPEEPASHPVVSNYIFEKYFTVVEDNAAVYDMNRSKEIGYLTKGQEYVLVADETDALRIQYGDGYAYVLKRGLEPSSGNGAKKLGNNASAAASFQVENDTVVYDNSTGQLIPFAVLKEGTSYPFLKLMGNWLEVNFSGRIGYVHASKVKRDFVDTDRYFRVVTERAPVYENRNGQLVAVGILHQNQEFQMVKRDGNWHQIKFGGQYRYIARKETEPASGIGFGKVSLSSANAGTIKVTKETIVYDNSSGKLVPFTSLSGGESFSILKRMGNWFEIEVSGRIGYVHNSSAQLVQPAVRDIVNPRQLYTYDEMKRDIQLLTQTYPQFIQSKVIGQSVDGRDIYAIKLGTGKKEIFFNGSHHAREYITTNLLMEMIDEYAESYVKGTKFGSYPTRSLLDQVSIWFVPMVNPDGVSLVQLGHKSAKNPGQVLKLNGNSTNFSAWKANIRGVDLNRQYPANWPNICCDPGKPGPQNYKGPKPLSEPETQALYRFALEHSFLTAVSYHSSGEILYWHFHQDAARQKRDYAIAKKISNVTGYRLVSPQKNPSGGGFTDWFISSQKLPAFTPEVSPYVGNGPVPIRNFDHIWRENHAMGLMMAQEALKIS